MKEHKGAKLIRINPEHPGFSKEFEDRAVSLPFEGIEALTKLNDLMSDDPSNRKARFIVHDEHFGAVAFQTRQDSALSRILARADIEAPWEKYQEDPQRPWWPPRATVRH